MRVVLRDRLARFVCLLLRSSAFNKLSIEPTLAIFCDMEEIAKTHRRYTLADFVYNRCARASEQTDAPLAFFCFALAKFAAAMSADNSLARLLARTRAHAHMRDAIISGERI